MDEDAHVSTSPAPAAAGQAGAAASNPPAAGETVADRLMSMADQYLHTHSLRQAAEIYFEMMDREGATASEVAAARRRLMQIADYYERTGSPHQAKGIYEQLGQ